MAKVITFSTHFQKGHPRAGQLTHFKGKILTSLILQALPCFKGTLSEHEIKLIEVLNPNIAKGHTIRAGKRWKVGEKFSPRVWSGKPYASPQIIIAHDVTIVKLWDIDIDENGVIAIDGKYVDEGTEKRLAKNDGLSEIDFFYWLIKPCMKKGKPFSGQIICWDENINY